MRILQLLVALLAALAVLVAASGGDGEDEGASVVVKTPVASSSASPSVA
jgi:ABC-type glycerol-3-phosphate transport system substrate-binding protein